MPRTALPIEPKTLTWARLDAGYPSIDAAVRGIASLRARPDGVGDLVAWEAGEKPLGKTAANTLAKAYDLPLPYLYLPVDVVRGLVPDVWQMRDFRMGPDRQLTPNMVKYLRSVLVRQEALRYILEAGEVPDLSWIGSGAGSTAAQVGLMIRQRVTGDDAVPKKLGDWIDRTESRFGIAVMQSRPAHHTHKPEACFSGAALADHTVPVIALNSDELPVRRVFTLLHELAHLLIGEPGISKTAFESSLSPPQSDVERFCNEAAAEALMPRDTFLASWRGEIARTDNVEAAVRRLGLDTGASYSAAVVRAARLNLLPVAEMERLLSKYTRFYEARKQKEAEKRAQRKAEGMPSGGVPQKYVALERAGPRMTKKALVAYDEGRISSMDLYDIFGVKLDHLPNIAAVVDHHLVRWQGVAQVE